MPWSFANRLDRLGRRKQELDSRTVKYRRGNLYVDLRASVSNQRRVEISPNTFTTVITPRNYILTANDLVLDGSLILPKAGDQILDVDGTYEVLPDGDNPPFDYTTQTRKRLRVNVKQVHSDSILEQP